MATPTLAPSPALIPPLQPVEAQVCVQGLIAASPGPGITRGQRQLRPFPVLRPSAAIPGSGRVETFLLPSLARAAGTRSLGAH